MSLIVNGVTIPENVANALNFNGTNITQVIYNGTTYWQQSLFSGIWSGSSDPGTYFLSKGSSPGLETSGTASRLNCNGYWSAQGGWIYSSSSGLGSGTSTAGNINYDIYKHDYAGATGIRAGRSLSTVWGSYVPFDITNKFGNIFSNASSIIGIQGSTPYIRSAVGNGSGAWAYGAWITLT